MRDFLDEVKHQRATSAKLVQRKAKHHRNQQHLQNFALGKCIDHRARYDVEQEVGGADHLARGGVGCNTLGVQRAGVNVHADAWLHQVDDHQADDQRQAADDFKIKQRQTAGLADFLHVFHAGNADHHRAKDDGRNDHLDQLDEAVAQRLHGGAGFGVKVPEQHANHDGRDDLEIKRAVKRLVGGIFFHGCLLFRR